MVASVLNRKARITVEGKHRKDKTSGRSISYRYSLSVDF